MIEKPISPDHQFLGTNSRPFSLLGPNQVEVINTGSELLLGGRVNTHLAYLGARLLSLGLRISRQATVPDSSIMRSAVEEALPRCDILLITGGLGPTTDDLTREIVADLLGRPLRPDANVRRKLEERLTRFQSPLRESMLRQTMVLEGAEVLTNNYGTAPGLYLPSGSQPVIPHIFLLPGPTHELKPLFENSVIPILSKLYQNDRYVEQRIFRVIGINETSIQEKIGGKLSLDGRLEVGYCPRFNEVDFRLIGPRSVLDEVAPEIYQTLGDHLFSETGESLEQIVVTQLSKKRETFAVAESCTGGLLANQITNIPNSSKVFLEGFVVYSNQAKVKTLGVSSNLIKSRGAVSKEVAQEMAEKTLSLTGATHALSLTGIAGPSGGTPSAPVGTVYIGFASKQLPTEVRKNLFPFDRETFKQFAAETALDILRRRLLAI